MTIFIIITSLKMCPLPDHSFWQLDLMSRTKEPLYYSIKFTRSITIYFPKETLRFLPTRYWNGFLNDLKKGFYNRDYNCITCDREYVLEKTKCQLYKVIRIIP